MKAQTLSKGDAVYRIELEAQTRKDRVVLSGLALAIDRWLHADGGSLAAYLCDVENERTREREAK